MKIIEDYFSSLDKFFRKQKSITKIEPRNPFKRLTDLIGRVEARIYFYDGSYLDAGETTKIEKGEAVNQDYRYHYQREDESVFTYDDVPDHKELETFPYHKHTYSKGVRKAEPHPKVTLTEVVKEIVKMLE